MIEIGDILSKIGLTSQESRVYLALLELQEAQTGLLCKFTKIASSNIYKILDSLMEKGLVSYRVQNNIKIFSSSPPEALNELFLEKEKSLDDERKEITKLITDLKTIPLKKEPYSNYKYYEGLQGIKSIWYEINSIMRPEKEIKIYTSRKEAYHRLLAFYDEHHKLRMKNGIKEKLIIPKTDVALAKKRKNKFTEIRLLELENEAEWGIVEDVFFIQYITAKVPRGFLIKDKFFAQAFEQVFDQLWKNSEKLV